MSGRTRNTSGEERLVLIHSLLFATFFLVATSLTAVLVHLRGPEAAASAPPRPDPAVGRRVSLPLLGWASWVLIVLAMVPGAAMAAPTISLDTPAVEGDVLSLSASLTSNNSCGAGFTFQAGCPANYTITGPEGFSGANLWWNDFPGAQSIQQDFDMSGFPGGTYSATLVASDANGNTYASNAQQFQWSEGGSVRHDAATGATTITDGSGALRVRMSAGACARGFGSSRCARFTAGGDTLNVNGGCRAEAADTVVCPLAGTYRIRLGGGDDRFAFASGGAAVAYKRLVVSGGPGDDSIVGGPGEDRLAGGRGRDRVIGDDPGCNWGDTYNCGGEDVVSGGAGDDVIDGSRAGDRLSGGRGDDRIAGDDPGCDPVIDPRCGGEDMVFGGPGNDIIVGGPSDDSVSGGNGADRIAGDQPSCNPGQPSCGGDDRAFGGPGDDIIFTGPGNDRISGGAGQNRIVADSTGCTPFDPRC